MRVGGGGGRVRTAPGSHCLLCPAARWAVTHSMWLPQCLAFLFLARAILCHLAMSQRTRRGGAPAPVPKVPLGESPGGDAVSRLAARALGMPATHCPGALGLLMEDKAGRGLYFHQGAGKEGATQAIRVPGGTRGDQEPFCLVGPTAPTSGCSLMSAEGYLVDKKPNQDFLKARIKKALFN